jgi:hypothetical protein
MNNIKTLAISIPALAIYRESIYSDFQGLPEMLNSAGIGTWSIGADGKFFCSCRLGKQMLGVSPNVDVGTRRLLKLLTPGCLRTVYYAFYSCFHSHNPIVLEIPLETVQGAATQKWIFLTGKFDPNLQQFRGLIYDITERKNVEADTSILLAKLNHELRTPLATIKLCTQRSLITARAARLDIASLLEKADHQINRMNNLIDEFLLVALNDSKRLILKKSFFYLKDVINEVLNGSFFGEYNERITISIDETQRLFADREKLVQVLNNYISNAVKYSPMDGRIIISSEQQKGKLKISVCDFGIGVNIIEQQKLFQKFYRCQNAGKIQGFGIGLFVVREIIEAHQGEVGIVSQIGEGSTFYFTLPINKSYHNS